MKLEGLNKKGFVVLRVVDPHAIDDGEPFSGKISKREEMSLSFAGGVVIEDFCPSASVSGMVREGSEGVAEILVASGSEFVKAGFSAAASDRHDSGKLLDAAGVFEFLAVVAKGAQEPWGKTRDTYRFRSNQIPKPNTQTINPHA